MCQPPLNSIALARADVNRQFIWLLNLIQYKQAPPPAEVDPHEIEKQAQLGKALWAQTEGIADVDSIERVCALYLKPRRERSGLAAVLAQAVGAGAD